MNYGGAGAWLFAFKEKFQGIEICGVDRPDIPESSLLIDRKFFCGHDLTKPLDLGRHFDLCVSVEVAEHLSAEHAPQLIDNISRHADRILFSAAIPHQGGTHHINEQWPQYWIKMFETRGYQTFDIIRPIIWDLCDIPVWYRQNLIYFSKDQVGGDLPNWHGVSLVHPQLFEDKMTSPIGGKTAVRALIECAKRKIAL